MNGKQTYKIIASKKFQMQLYDLTNYLANISPKVAKNMRKDITENINLLKLFPQLGKLLDCDDEREQRILIVKKYIILYTFCNEEICLQMILDEKLDYYHYI